MREVTGNLFDLEADAICITTNGIVDAGGTNTMGRGCAGEAKHRYPGIQMMIGEAILEHGNHVYILTEASARGKWILRKSGARVHQLCPSALISFPTKEHWRNDSIPKLIERSAEELLGLTQAFGFESVLLPRPGCGAGGLSWDDIFPMLNGILDDRFTAVTFK